MEEMKQAGQVGRRFCSGIRVGYGPPETLPGPEPNGHRVHPNPIINSVNQDITGQTGPDPGGYPDFRFQMPTLSITS